MRDPHVEWLEYEIAAGWLFADPPPLDWETSVFQANLDRGILRVNPRDHFATEAEARAAVEPFLLTWEIDIALRYGQREMKFAFKQSHVVDRDPPPPPPPGVITGVVETMQARASMSATGQVTRKNYPAVPSNFFADPNVVTLWDRFERLKNGSEPFPQMAYFCFTMLMFCYGGTVKQSARRGRSRRVETASKALAIDEDVLMKVSELSSIRGDPSTARKMTPGLAPFATTEARWLDAAVLALIRRIGEIAYVKAQQPTHSPAQLTMKDLPPL